MENEKLIGEFIIQDGLDSALNEVLNILDADDGKSFEEKKESVLRFLRKGTSSFSEPLVNIAADDISSEQIKNAFWHAGRIECCETGIYLRAVEEQDRSRYLSLQRVYNAMRHMLKEPKYCDMVWNEHTSSKTLMLAIIKDEQYIGYCGINNTTQEPWDIAIEIDPNWTNHGIGSIVLPAMLNAIKVRLGVTGFRVRIDPGNTASQKLFEKLGAAPNGISEFYIHDQEVLEKIEEDNLHLLNEHFNALAAKFHVEPRKLLSHALEYTLLWS